MDLATNRVLARSSAGSTIFTFLLPWLSNRLFTDPVLEQPLMSWDTKEKTISGMDTTGLVPNVFLKDIAPAAANNINTRFIMLEKGEVKGQNKTCLCLVADETASVHFQLWGDECDGFEPGDIIQLSNGIFSFIRKCLALRAGKRGKIVKVGEFTMTYVETPNMSEIEWVPDPSDSKKYVQKVVISPYSRIFPPQQ